VEGIMNFSYLEKVKTYLLGLDFNSFRVDLSNRWLDIACLILAISLLVFVINFLLVRSVFGQNYRLFAAPGVIIHELSHAFLCILTGAKITKIALFDKEGGSVAHTESKIPILGPTLISLAPFILGIIAIYFLADRLGIRSIQVDIAHFNFIELLGNIKLSLLSIKYTDYKNLIILYLILSIAVTLTPSKEDFKNMFIPALILLIIWCALFFFHLIPNFLQHIPSERLIAALTTTVFLLILAVVLSMIVFVFSKLIKRS
jgi:hypothetical protein